MSILGTGSNGVFRRKTIEDIEPEDPGSEGGLDRALGVWQLTALGVGVLGLDRLDGLASEDASTAGPEDAHPGTLPRMGPAEEAPRAPMP